MKDQTQREIVKLTVELIDKGHKADRIEAAICQLYNQEMTKGLETIVRGTTEMLQSLADAIIDAGGSGWPADELLKMTILDLFSSLATNGVRFHFSKKATKQSS